jgi:predicted ATPase
MLRALAVDGYRSIRSLVLPLEEVTVVTGANGAGKSNLYRALRLLSEVPRDGAIRSIVREGGFGSVLWAGPETVTRAVREGGPTEGTRRSGPVALRLGFGADDLGYAIDLGLPVGGSAAFARDPEVKAEAVWAGETLRPGSLLSERHGGVVRVREDGDWVTHGRTIAPWSSMIAEAGDPRSAPELLGLRDTLRSWRFFDHVRTDADAPARRRAIGTRTPVLAADGADLAAAVETLRDLGDGDAFDRAVDEAFPGSRVEIAIDDGWFALRLRQPGMLRPLDAAELSDGTLRYLVWVAALLSPRPAELLVLNEPETSLHPDLLEPLARLVLRAATSSQTIVVTHSASLARALSDFGAARRELVREHGETRLAGQGPLDGPAWSWPKR